MTLVFYMKLMSAKRHPPPPTYTHTHTHTHTLLLFARGHKLWKPLLSGSKQLGETTGPCSYYPQTRCRDTLSVKRTAARQKQNWAWGVREEWIAVCMVCVDHWTVYRFLNYVVSCTVSAWYHRQHSGGERECELPVSCSARPHEAPQHHMRSHRLFQRWIPLWHICTGVNLGRALVSSFKK
jgi:hypothetical protein